MIYRNSKFFHLYFLRICLFSGIHASSQEFGFKLLFAFKDTKDLFNHGRLSKKERKKKNSNSLNQRDELKLLR